MKFIHRFAYFLMGLTVGSIFVYFIWNKKDVVFNYFPNSRLLSNLNNKKIHFSQNFKDKCRDLNIIDSLIVTNILEDGDVDFWNKVKIDSCIEYNISGSKKFKNMTLTIINCDSTATIQHIILSKQ
jgi:hypothetical protein